MLVLLCQNLKYIIGNDLCMDKQTLRLSFIIYDRFRFVAPNKTMLGILLNKTYETIQHIYQLHKVFTNYFQYKKHIIAKEIYLLN